MARRCHTQTRQTLPHAALAIGSNGDLVVTNGNDGNIVEITTQGRQIAKLGLVKNGAGALFGIALSAAGNGIVFVNDGANAIETASPRN